MSKYPSYGSEAYKALCSKRKGEALPEVCKESPKEEKVIPKVVSAAAPMPVKPRKKHPRVSDEGGLNLSYIIAEKPPRKVVIDFLKDKAEKMMEDSSDEEF